VTAPIPADLSALSVRELLGIDAAVIAELARRRLVSTNDKPIGGIAERIVHRARGGALEPNSTKSHDVTTPTGIRIERAERNITLDNIYRLAESLQVEPGSLL